MKIIAPDLREPALTLFYEVTSKPIPMPAVTTAAKQLIAKRLAFYDADTKSLQVTWYGAQALTELVFSLPENGGGHKTSRGQQAGAFEGIKAFIGSRGVKVGSIGSRRDILKYASKMFQMPDDIAEEELYTLIKALSKKERARRAALFISGEGSELRAPDELKRFEV